jgi:type IX secretion system PorP/SprF family membrane protein
MISKFSHVNNNPKIAWMFLFAFGAFITAKAQFPTFRQQFAQRSLLNPALIGTSQINQQDAIRVGSGTKAQWLGISSRLATQNLAFDMPVNNTNMAWGINLYATDLYSGSENQSKYSHFSASAHYAYSIPIKKSRLRAGLSLQYSSFTFGKDRFLWEDQINASNTGFVLPTQEPLNKLTRNVFHASAGLIYYSKKGFIGVSAFNINQPNIGFYDEASQKIPLRYSAIAGYRVTSDDAHTSLTPSVNYTYQDGLHSTSLMFNTSFNNFRVGAGTQHARNYMQNAWSVNYYFGARYDRYYIGYSNDWNITMQGQGIPVTHEFSLLIFPKVYNRSKHPNPFPEF